MKTSLVIPAWNAEKTILDCILSAIQADDSPEEIIIVDDCSNDKTANLILNFKDKYSKIKLLKMKVNSGPSAARDYGVKEFNLVLLSTLCSQKFCIYLKIKKIVLYSSYAF